jgi:hypothetical protein
MSSKSSNSLRAQAWVVLICMVLVTLWYASSQLLYSLYFAYQLARLLFPGIMPDVGSL